jgi:hypothetical protein
MEPSDDERPTRRNGHLRARDRGAAHEAAPARVRRYVRVGLSGPARVEGRKTLLQRRRAGPLRTIRRLGEDLGLNAAAWKSALRLVDEIRTLRRPRLPSDR